MSTLTRSQIEHLATVGEGPHVSLYLPTTHEGDPTVQGPIRLRRLLARVARELANGGTPAAEVSVLLAPAVALVDDADTWRRPTLGLALFLDAESMQAFHLPFEVPELALVADRFHLKPLLPLLCSDGRYHLLALSLGGVRLFEGCRDTITRVNLKGIPTSLREARGESQAERSLPVHAAGGPAGPGGHREADFPRQGPAMEDTRRNIEEFLRQVDAGVLAVIAGHHAPLVIAAVDYMADLYRAVTKHSHVLTETVSGDPDALSAEELHRRAWRVIAPRLRARRDVAEAAWRQLRPSNRSSTELRTILRAAHDGRVAAIWVAVGRQCWGSYDAASNHVTLHAQHVPGDRDLLDLAVIESLLSGADIFAVPPDEVPGGGVIAATFRD